jgi:hypothetical protein
LSNLLFGFNAYLQLEYLKFVLFRPIFGEMKILDEISDEENCVKLGNCPQKSGVIFNYIGFMIYMIVVNVLLLNLLIAMFRLYLSFIIYYYYLMLFL